MLCETLYTSLKELHETLRVSLKMQSVHLPSESICLSAGAGAVAFLCSKRGSRLQFYAACANAGVGAFAIAWARNRATTSNGWTALHRAAHNGHTAALHLALRFVEVDARTLDGEWTPLHIAVTAGHENVVSLLVCKGAKVDLVDQRGDMALIMAVAKGHEGIASCLLKAGACTSNVNKKGASAMHVAVARGSIDLVRLLINYGASVNVQDFSGYTPLMLAASKKSKVTLVIELLKNNADPNIESHRTGRTALLEASKTGCGDAVLELLKAHADPGISDRFGTSPLHEACNLGHTEAVLLLCDGAAPALAQDNDGQYPLDLALVRCADAPNDLDYTEAVAALLRTEPKAVSALDFGDATVLHTLCSASRRKKTAPLKALQLLLDAKADVTVEDESGWTPAHHAAHEDTPPAMLAMLREHSGSSQFWDTFQDNKERGKSNAKYLAHRGGHHRIPIEDRKSVLQGDATLASIARCIQNKRGCNIVLLIGAGASTSAGIPDFRSSNGIWSDPEKAKLHSPQGFLAQPQMFWTWAVDNFASRQPTSTHKLLAKFHELGSLLRVYTQNIDGLEEAAAVPSEKVVQCHGSIQRCICSAGCKHAASNICLTDIQRDMAAGLPPPRCTSCKALLRPAIVFFGEQISPDFMRLSGEDLRKCDVFIVMGTTLSVYPVASIVNEVPKLAPRLLINKERVGPWRSAAGYEGDCNTSSYRDVFFGGACDDGAMQLAQLLGWNDL
jgi:NAD-dependent deacetylase sirtuin 2